MPRTEEFTQFPQPLSLFAASPMSLPTLTSCHHLKCAAVCVGLCSSCRQAGSCLHCPLSARIPSPTQLKELIFKIVHYII